MNNFYNKEEEKRLSGQLKAVAELFKHINGYLTLREICTLLTSADTQGKEYQEASVSASIRTLCNEYGYKRDVRPRAGTNKLYEYYVWFPTQDEFVKSLGTIVKFVEFSDADIEQMRKEKELELELAQYIE